jgi:hypothetical protein
MAHGKNAARSKLAGHSAGQSIVCTAWYMAGQPSTFLVTTTRQDKQVHKDGFNTKQGNQAQR